MIRLFKKLVYLFCFLLTIFFTEKLVAQSIPYVQYEQTRPVKIKKESEGLEGQKINERTVSAFLGVPLFSRDYLDLYLTLSLYRSQLVWSKDDLKPGFLSSRDNSLLGIAAIIKGWNESYEPFFSLMQRNSIKMDHSHPVPVVAAGISGKGSFFNVIAPSRSKGSAAGVRVSFFPRTYRYVIFLNETWRWGFHELSLSFPSGGVYKYHLVNNQSYLEFGGLGDDMLVSPFETSDGVKGWSYDSTTLTLFAGYERIVFGPLYMNIRIGVRSETANYFNTKDEKILKWETGFTPWGSISLKAVL